MIYSTWKHSLPKKPSKRFLFFLIGLLGLSLPVLSQDSIRSYGSLDLPVGAKVYIPNLSNAILHRCDTAHLLSPCRYGVVSPSGKVLIPFAFHSIDKPNGSAYYVVSQKRSEKGKIETLYGAFTLSGKMVTEVKWKSLIALRQSSLLIAQHPSGQNYLLVNGSPVWKHPFEGYALPLHSGHLIIYQNNRAGLIDSTGFLKLNCQYKNVEVNDTSFTGIAFPTWEIKNAANTRLGQIVADSLSDKDSLSGYWINAQFVPLPLANAYLTPEQACLPERPFAMRIFFEDSFYIKQKERVGPDTILTYESKGWMLYRKKGWYGYCDTLHNIQIAPKYDSMLSFSEDRAAVMIRGKWGFLDREETLVVQPYYDEVRSFACGNALVRQKKKWLCIDPNGKTTHEGYFDSIQYLSTGNRLIFQNGKAGLLDVYGKERLAIRYDNITDTGLGVFLVEQYGRYALVDPAENYLIPYQSAPLYWLAKAQWIVYAAAGENKTVPKSTLPSKK